MGNWQLVRDEKSGHAYYWDSVTNAVRWDAPADAPSAADEQAAASQSVSTPAADAPAASALTPVVGASVCEGGSAEAPAGWQLVPDSASGAAYWWHQETNEVRWERPDAMPSTGAVDEAAASGTDSPGLSTAAPPQRQPPAAPPAAPPASAPLPAGWIESCDPSGARFYVHAASGQSSWTRPEQPPQQPQPAQEQHGLAPLAMPQRRQQSARPQQQHGAGHPYARPQQQPQQQHGGGRGSDRRRGFMARQMKRAAADPLDPASWEGYEVPVGGWSKGLADQPPGAGGAGARGGAQPTAASSAQPAAGGPPVRRAGPLPSPGDIMRMNAQAGGGGGAEAGSAPAAPRPAKCNGTDR